jgi:hypothetical protein
VYYGHQACTPLEAPPIGNYNITDLNFEFCAYHIQKLSQQYETLRQTELTITQLHGHLAPEISKVWRHQMPEQFKKYSLSIGINI